MEVTAPAGGGVKDADIVIIYICHDHQHVGLQAQCDGGSTVLPARTGPRQVNRADIFMFMCYPEYVC